MHQEEEEERRGKPARAADDAASSSNLHGLVYRLNDDMMEAMIAHGQDQSSSSTNPLASALPTIPLGPDSF